MSRTSPTARATLTIALCAVLFGLVPLFARILQAEGMDPAAIALSRYGLTALVAAPFLPWRRAVRRQVLVLAGTGLACGLGWVAYLEAIGRTTVAAAGVVYMSYPAFALGFAWLLLGLAPSGRAVAAAAMVLAGALLVSGGAGVGDPLALLLMLPAPAFFALVIVALAALAPDLAPMEKLAATMAGTVAGLLPLAALAAPGTLLPGTGPGWAALLGSGLLTALLPQWLYVRAAPHVGPGRAAAAGAFELPTMLAIGALAFGELVGPREVAAALLVLAAIGLSPSVRPAGPAPARPGAGRLSRR
ncbi:DMT family transporter [Halovulum marinum]|nr:DMT family transporter [Halovulum marinum]